MLAGRRLSLTSSRPSPTLQATSQCHVQVASFLKDQQCAEEAARHLAAAVRSALRSSVTSTTHLPAIDAPVATTSVSHPAIAALDCLLPADAEIVFRLLHPLELCHLPEPHRSAAVDTYATPTPPAVDLSAPQLTPLTPAPSRWEDACEHALSTIGGRPISTLHMSHVGETNASYLCNICPQLSVLSMRSTHVAPTLTFLHHADSLTRLDIAWRHAPHASLLDTLFGLSNLRRLSLHLSTLSEEDSARVESLARLACATMDDAAAPGAQHQPHRLWGVTHAAIIATEARPVQGLRLVTLKCRWPAQLACLLDFQSLETLTCFPPYLGTGHPVLRRGSCAPPRLSALTLINPGTGAGFGQDLIDVPAGLATLARSTMLNLAESAAGSGGLAPLTRLAFCPPERGGELLRQLPGLQDLTLADVPPDHVQLLSEVLPCLTTLQSLCVSLEVDPDATRPKLVYSLVVPECDALCGMLCALRSLPLTRLLLARSPPLPQVLCQLATHPGLVHLEWTPTPLHEGYRPQSGAFDEAAACMLRSCTSLTALSLHLTSLPQLPSPQAVALAALPQLRHLTVTVSLKMRAPQGAVPTAAPPLALPALRRLTLELNTDSGALLQLPWLACWDVHAVTRLRIGLLAVDPDRWSLARAQNGRASMEALFCGDAPLLGRTLRLQELVLPQHTLRMAVDARGAGPLLRRLTRLERLVACHGIPEVAEALLPFVRDLPLGRGVL